MVNVSRKNDIVPESSDASPVSRVVARKPVTWAEAMIRIRQAIAALPREADLTYGAEEAGWELEPDAQHHQTPPPDESEAPPPPTQRSR